MHVVHTKGGSIGYWWRRSIHVSMAILPILYYQYGQRAADFFHITPVQFVLAIILVNVIFEAIRLAFGITVWGHRAYEKKQISSFAWGIFSIGVVLVFAKSPAFSIPIIWGCAFGDPLLGELRRLSLPKRWVVFFGALMLLVVWLGSSYWLGTPWWYAIIMTPLVLLAEWPTIKWVDDNALMQLLPLLLVLILQALSI